MLKTFKEFYEDATGSELIGSDNIQYPWLILSKTIAEYWLTNYSIYQLNDNAKKERNRRTIEKETTNIG